MSWHLFKQEFKALLIIIAFVLLYKGLKIHCLIYNATGFPCPTCNMTRAVISLIKLDMKAYAAYNIMALPVFVVFVLQVFNGFFENKKALNIITLIVMTINLIYYVLVLIPKFKYMN